MWPLGQLGMSEPESVCEERSVRLPSQRRAHAVPGSEKTPAGKRASIVWRQTVYAEQPGGIMCSPDGIMSSILIVLAGLASVDQLMSCGFTEEPL